MPTIWRVGGILSRRINAVRRDCAGSGSVRRLPDAEADYSTQIESQHGLLFAEQYLEAASYGKLDIEFAPLHHWLRVEHNYDHYLGRSRNGERITGEIDEDAVRLADPDFDFTGQDIVMIVMPSSHFGGGNAGGRVSTEEGGLSTTRVNTSFSKSRLPHEWGSTAAHELAHNLGLSDLYDRSGSRAPRPPEVEGWTWANMGLMGFSIWLPPGYGYGFERDEMLAWSRWQLGWLDPTQIRCITDPEATVTLSPVANPGNGPAMAAIPLSGTELIVIESRRKLGYDTDSGIWADRDLLPEGVLVYTVDAGLSTGLLPIKGANETTSGFSRESPFLTEGQSTTVAGYTITLQSDDGETHTVKISKTSVG